MAGTFERRDHISRFGVKLDAATHRTSEGVLWHERAPGIRSGDPSGPVEDSAVEPAAG
jgi:hypothetical protein